MVNRKAPHFGGTGTPSSSPFTMNQRRRLTSAGAASPRTPLSGPGRGGRGISSVRGFVSGATPTATAGRNSAGNSGNGTGPGAATRNSLEISPNMLPPLPCLMTSDETVRQRIDNSPTKNQKMRVILDSAMQVMTNHFDQLSSSSHHDDSRHHHTTDRHNHRNNFDDGDEHDDNDGQIL